MDNLTIWLTLYQRYLNSLESKSKSFDSWLQSLAGPSSHESQDDAPYCLFSEEIQKLLGWKTCPDQKMISSQIEKWQQEKNKDLEIALHLLKKRKNTRTKFRELTKDLTLTILDESSIPSDFLWFLQNEFGNLLSCDLNCESGNLLFLLWYRNDLEAWAVVDDQTHIKQDDAKKEKKIVLECLCARKNRSHSLKIGSLLINLIQEYFHPRSLYLASTPSALGFYLKMGFIPDLIDIQNRLPEDEWKIIKDRLSNALAKKEDTQMISILQDLKKFISTIPMKK